MDDHVARLDQRQHQRGDRRHARREDQRILGLVPDAEAILEDLLIGSVEARIDQPLGAARPLAGDAFEMALTRRRILEHEGRGQEDGGLERPFGQGRIEGVAHHQRRGRQAPPADFEDFGLGPAAGRDARDLGLGLWRGVVGHKILSVSPPGGVMIPI
jgi:hypothetical protein